MKWFSLSLACDHTVYVRLEDNEKPPVGEGANALCGYCVHDRKTKRLPKPTAWANIKSTEEVSDEHVRGVSDGNAFLMRRNVMFLVPGRNNPYPFRGQ